MTIYERSLDNAAYSYFQNFLDDEKLNFGNISTLSAGVHELVCDQGSAGIQTVCIYVVSSC